MKKIKLKQLVKELYKQELEIFLDPEVWIDNTEKEKAKALKEFKQEWNEIESIDELIGTLCERGYDEDDAVDMVLQAMIDEDED
jgi:hypothetical protein